MKKVSKGNNMEYIIKWLTETLYFLNEISVYLLFGLLIAGVLHVLFPDSLVRKQLGKGSLGSVLKATLFGIPIPLCSCGVVPVARSLERSGASKGSIVSFLIATPQIGADSFMVTYSLLGWLFGVFRIAASFLTALIAGFWVNLLSRPGSAEKFSGPGSAEESPGERIKGLFHYVEFELLGSIANALIIGILIAGLISAFIPETIFESYLGNSFLSMVLMMIIGIPLYVCASASTPIAASLLMKGVSPGAALVFLLTGPATNAVNISTVSSIIGKKFTVLYIGVVAAVSLLLGGVLNYLSIQLNLSEHMHHHHEILPSFLRYTGTFVLVILLIYYYVSKRIAEAKEISQQYKLNVEGMTCMHCKMNVEKAAGSVDGISNVVVDLDDNNIQFDAEDTSLIQKVKNKIHDAGYGVK